MQVSTLFGGVLIWISDSCIVPLSPHVATNGLQPSFAYQSPDTSLNAVIRRCSVRKAFAHSVAISLSIWSSETNIIPLRFSRQLHLIRQLNFDGIVH
jgi:hypothetical protein